MRRVAGYASRRLVVDRAKAPSLIRHTLRELMVLRRAVPIAIVAVPMVFLEARWSRDQYAWLLGLVMVFAFVSIAPLAWRVLMEDGLDLSHGAIRLLLYAGVAVGTVGAVGVAIPYAFEMGPSILTAPTSLIVCVALFIAGGWGLGRDIQLEAKLESERARADELARVAEQAQLAAIRANLDPHFLFNTLNAIAEWCRIDGVMAEQAVLKLSALLRLLLDGVQQAQWPLSREIRLVRDLFELHLLRDPNLFTLRWEGLDTSDPNAHADVLVPPMLLLSMAENAVKHGPASGFRGLVTVRLVREPHSVRIAMENPGPYGGPREASMGIALIEKRLQVAYGTAATFSIEGMGERTTASVTLPVREQAPSKEHS
ncbi:MAG: histidine kinase [Sandaracinaceae bacterium]|nr:histidine kinase [Sandaracinaceae bacterium]